MPVSRTEIRDVGTVAADRQRDRAAGVGILDRVVQEVAQDLFQPCRVGREPDRLIGDCDLERVTRLPGEWAGASDRPLDNFREVDDLFA